MSVTVITGPVKAGKSKKLIEYYNQLENCGVMVFSSKYSLTNGESVVSRYGTKIKAIPINTLNDILCHIGSKFVKYILIDEFQFLQMKVDDMLSFFYKYGNSFEFFIFGIPNDYRRKPFPLMANIMTFANKVEIIGGYCDICGAVPSRYSLRLENDKPANIKEEGQVILLDGEYSDVDVKYQAICDDCWRKIYG